MTDQRSAIEIAGSGDHRFMWLGAGDPETEKGIASNQYAIVAGGEALLLDPGGYHSFERVFANVAGLVEPKMITGVFLSHQDPDVVGSLVSWLEVQPAMKIYVSGLWERFLPHFALPSVPDFVAIPDEGSRVTLSDGAELRFVPAHGLHSPGNFALYDERTRVLFSGDLGAALVPPGEWSMFVGDFEKHCGYMDGFHRRFLASTKALRAFLDQIHGLPIDCVCPQHGSIFRGDDVRRFFDWLAQLEVGFDHRDWGKAR